MTHPNRREFLVGSLAGAIALGASRLAPAAVMAEEPAAMTIAKWSGAKELSGAEMKQAAVKLTEQAMAGLGGMKRFVSRGAAVWVKPNIGWDIAPELAGNTNPDVVETIVRLCFEAGAKTVKVGDNACDLAAKTYVASGIADAARRAGAEVLFLDKTRAKEVAIKGERIKSIPIFPEMIECDLLINVPIAKHHRLSNATLCMKNYMGVIEKRNTFHQDISTCVADLTRFLQPRLCLLDAVRVLKDHGPKGGDAKDVEVKLTLAAGTDIVALDAWGMELLGKALGDNPAIAKGIEYGLGRSDYRAIAKEIAVS
jgi:uncharacterized protein (DUF362 family)